MLPRSLEAVWHVAPSGSVYVVEDRARSGKALVTLAVPDIEAMHAALTGRGIAVDRGTEDAVASVVVVDPDGNTLKFFEEPQTERS
ncbi:MAG TPA: hypothetical protein VGM80_05300 [Gaiellaceae bacterium]|jgi:catechol 2,3-dioxygenase-like lactoylglutathione lyase family enzyme